MKGQNKQISKRAVERVPTAMAQAQRQKSYIQCLSVDVSAAYPVQIESHVGAKVASRSGDLVGAHLE